MKSVTLIPLLFIALLSFSSCDKDDDDSKTETKAELIADKNWLLTGLTSKENNDPVEDEFVDLDACEKDNTFRFNKSGTYEISEGATKCDSADPQVAEQGTWSITGDDLIITESGDTPESIKITELTKSKLVLTLTVTYMNDTYVEVLTFNAQ